MAFYDEFLKSESGNWNVALDFARLKIMKPLYLVDEYEKMAKNGYTSLIEEIQNPIYYNTDELKLKGFQRLLDELLLIYSNTYFAVKKQREAFDKHEQNLLKIEKIYHKLFTKTYNQINRTTTIKINYQIYDKVLKILSKIKKEMNEQLNMNDLIFTNKKEFDTKKFKNVLFERMTNKG